MREKHLAAYNQEQIIEGSPNEIARMIGIGRTTVDKYCNRRKKIKGWKILESWWHEWIVTDRRTNERVQGRSSTKISMELNYNPWWLIHLSKTKSTIYQVEKVIKYNQEYLTIKNDFERRGNGV